MKNLLRYLAFVLMVGGAYAQTNPREDLPLCDGSPTKNIFILKTWSNCKGTYEYQNGSKFIGGWKNGVRNGKGIQLGTNGTSNWVGVWENGNFVREEKIDLSQFDTDVKNDQEIYPSKIKLESTVQIESLIQPNRIIVNTNKERRVALVIGNAAYKNSPLRNPVNDSSDMAKSLRGVGFDVIEINNATLQQMREATRRFSDKLTNNDVGLVYYSGHGIEVKGRNYLVPVNADIKREYEVIDQAFDANQFLEMMEINREQNTRRVNILIVDACRNNELPRSWRSSTSGLARMDAPGGTFISFATSPGKVASDGEGRNSPYTKHLIQALKQPNVPIEQVFKIVRRNVMDETKGEQVPWENSSLVGDFYFTVSK